MRGVLSECEGVRMTNLKNDEKRMSLCGAHCECASVRDDGEGVSMRGGEYVRTYVRSGIYVGCVLWITNSVYSCISKLQ